MRRYRELNIREREEFTWLANNDWIRDEWLTFEEGGDPDALLPILRAADQDSKVDISPVLEFVRQEYAELKEMLRQHRHAFREARPIGGFRWRILLMVADRHPSETKFIQLHGRSDALSGPYLLLGQSRGGPRNLEEELSVIRRAYDLIEQESSVVKQKRVRNVPVQKPEDLVQILMTESGRIRSNVRFVLDRYLFEFNMTGAAVTVDGGWTAW